MDIQDGQDNEKFRIAVLLYFLYLVYPVHPCKLKNTAIWEFFSCELPYVPKSFVSKPVELVVGLAFTDLFLIHIN
jgi:hypothetical protein